MRKFCILGHDFYPYQLGLLDLCEFLHMFHTGSLEIYEAYPIYIAVKYLRDSLKGWRKTPISRSVIYDEAVRNLCTVALNDVTSRGDWREIMRCAKEEYDKGFVRLDYFNEKCQMPEEVIPCQS